MESYVHELERNMSPGAEAEELRARFSMPPLYTLAYRLRNEAGCCAWDEPDHAATLLLADLQAVSQQIFTLWNHFQQMLPHCTTQLSTFEHAKYGLQRARHTVGARWTESNGRAGPFPPVPTALSSRWRIFLCACAVCVLCAGGRVRPWLVGAISCFANPTRLKIGGAWDTQTCQATARKAG